VYQCDKESDALGPSKQWRDVACSTGGDPAALVGMDVVMVFNQQKLHRRSIRLNGFDYTQPGAYFITIVTSQREEIFGEISNGEMRLNQLGEIVRTEWLKTVDIRSSVELHEHEFVIMPNHLHGIIWIVDKKVGATRWVAPAKRSRTLEAGSIGAMLAQFKSITAKRINALRATPGIPVWHRNYFEHIIRDEIEFGAICNYIQDNPLKWQEDQENPALKVWVP
jgi:putative transposase